MCLGICWDIWERFRLFGGILGFFEIGAFWTIASKLGPCWRPRHIPQYLPATLISPMVTRAHAPRMHHPSGLILFVGHTQTCLRQRQAPSKLPVGSGDLFGKTFTYHLVGIFFQAMSDQRIQVPHPCKSGCDPVRQLGLTV